MQRRHRDAMAVGSGHAGDPAPIGRPQATGTLIELDRRTLVEIQAAEQLLQRRGAHFVGDPGGADVGAVDQDFRHVDPAAKRMVVLDAEAADGQRRGRVITLAHRSHDARIHGRRDRQRLERRTQLIAGLHHMVAERRFGAALAGIILQLVGIEHRDRCHGDHFAGIDVQDDAARALGPCLDQLGIKLAFQRALHPAVDRHGEGPATLRRIDHPIIERGLHAHAALALGIGRKAENMRGQRALGIEALLLARKFDTDLAQRVHRRHFLGQRAAAQIGPAAPPQLLGEHRFGLVREDFMQLARQFVGIADQLGRAHRDRIGVHGPRQRHAIAVAGVKPDNPSPLPLPLAKMPTQVSRRISTAVIIMNRINSNIRRLCAIAVRLTRCRPARAPPGWTMIVAISGLPFARAPHAH